MVRRGRVEDIDSKIRRVHKKMKRGAGTQTQNGEQNFSSVRGEALRRTARVLGLSTDEVAKSLAMTGKVLTHDD